MNTRIAKVFEIGCSGLVGVILTLGVQYIFPSHQVNEFNMIIDGKEYTFTESNASDLVNENTDLKNQLAHTQNDLTAIQTQLSETQTQLSSKEEELQNIISQTPNVEYSDFDININGEVTENLKKAFLNIDGREFISFDVLNKITEEEIKYSDNVLSVGHVTGKKVNLMDVCPPYDISRVDYYNTDSFNMTGKTYNGFWMDLYRSEYVLINLDEQYSKIEFDFGHVDGSGQNNCILNIYLDDKLIKAIEQRADSNISHVDIPLNYGKHLKIEFDGSYTKYGLGNIKLKY